LAQTNQHSPRRLDARKKHDEAYSEALKSSGSGASQSLDGHKNDRDMARKAVEIAQAKEKTAQAAEKNSRNGREKSISGRENGTIG
jgi:hypothetical protein